MSKRSGIGMGAAYGGYDLADDIGALTIGGGPAVIEVTPITKAAPERLGGLIDGHIDLDAFLDDAAGQMHVVGSALPTTDRQIIVFLASTIGASAACMVGKQLDYAPTRNADGALPITLPHPANGFGMEWCELLTAGYRTDTSGSNGTALDDGAATTTGWAAYLQVLDVTGTNVVVTLEDSANNIAFSAVTAGAFTSVTTDRSVQRITGAAGATLRQYVRVVTSGTFSSATFIVAVTRRPIGS